MERRDHAGMARNEKVLNCSYPNPGAIFKLICFPWAGGGSFHFAKWGQSMQDFVEVYSIRLAGRESRLEEPIASDPDQVVDEIVCALLPVIQDKPFAFFGHSMGSYTAFLTAVQLKKEHKLEPIHLFLSSSFAPYEKNSRLAEYQQMSDEQASVFLTDIGGTPKNLTDNKELFKQTISKMRADGELFKKYIFDITTIWGILTCDLTCFQGSDDTIIKDMKAWAKITSGNTDIHVLPGDHFYLMETSNENFIKNYITKSLEFSMFA
ncbi:PREDICTED: S-acyl fatty acid synthase thioesterase, medium chain [Hipposideros armiger]|uniref:S-acyl fatty acid synthase thioesterase, medium chain n=1 Tax=Hipposideros armiger TaxID=186990 RepID=A0A8B7T4C1_HIPAR|nr:PREDICTED: S-acyl fatty acid synthase thioesterase, medium chain [Hipposideros armiger]